MFLQKAYHCLRSLVRMYVAVWPCFPLFPLTSRKRFTYDVTLFGKIKLIFAFYSFNDVYSYFHLSQSFTIRNMIDSATLEYSLQ